MDSLVYKRLPQGGIAVREALVFSLPTWVWNMWHQATLLELYIHILDEAALDVFESSSPRAVSQPVATPSVGFEDLQRLVEARASTRPELPP